MTANPTLVREYCVHCKHVTKPFYPKCPVCEGTRNRGRVERLARVIRELKATVYESVDPQRERELVSALHDDHPDPSRFLAWLEAEREKAQRSQHSKQGRRR